MKQKKSWNNMYLIIILIGFGFVFTVSFEFYMVKSNYYYLQITRQWIIYDLYTTYEGSEHSTKGEGNHIKDQQTPKLEGIVSNI